LLTFAELYGRAMAGGESLIPFRLTQSDLASLAGATRERVNRVITSYKRRRYISVDEQRRITIRNPEALRRRLRVERQAFEAQKAA
jgi:CRP/FNR family transcriptional regulator